MIKYILIYCFFICAMLFSCVEKGQQDIMYDCLSNRVEDLASLESKARMMEVYSISKGVLGDSTKSAYRSLFFKLNNNLMFRDSFARVWDEYNGELMNLSEFYLILNCCFESEEIQGEYKDLCRVVMNFETEDKSDFLKMDLFLNDLGKSAFERHVIYRGIFMEYLIFPTVLKEPQHRNQGKE